MALYAHKPQFAKVIVRGREIFMNVADFNSMAMYRAERIHDGSRYNTGPMIRDQFADAGQQLDPGGEATVWEVVIFSDSLREIEDIFGKNWAEPLEGESRSNPRWQ